MSTSTLLSGSGTKTYERNKLFLDFGIPWRAAFDLFFFSQAIVSSFTTGSARKEFLDESLFPGRSGIFYHLHHTEEHPCCTVKHPPGFYSHRPPRERPVVWRFVSTATCRESAFACTEVAGTLYRRAQGFVSGEQAHVLTTHGRNR